jgi:hypothetical protein
MWSKSAGQDDVCDRQLGDLAKVAQAAAACSSGLAASTVTIPSAVMTKARSEKSYPWATCTPGRARRPSCGLREPYRPGSISGVAVPGSVGPMSGTLVPRLA